MKTFARTSNWAWAATLLASLMMTGLADSLKAQYGGPSNPLRHGSYAPPTTARDAGGPDENSRLDPLPVKRTEYRRSSESRQAAARLPVSNGRTAGFVPKHEREAAVRQVQAVREESSRLLPRPAPPIPADPPTMDSDDFELLPGETLVEGPSYEGFQGPFEPAMSGIPAKHGCCDGGGCAECCQPCSLISLHNLEVFAGSQGFTGPLNRGQTGSFGFHYGANWGTPLPLPCLGAQLGARVTQSNFSGAEFTDDSRSQVFLTAGLFRRVDWGLQGGLAVDFLRDDWYLELDVTQLRGELSWVFPNCHELGFWFTSATESSTSEAVVFNNLNDRVLLTEDVEANDLFAFFYRRRVGDLGGAFRVFAGFSGESDALLGTNLNMPLSDRLSIRTEFTYLIPEDRNDRLDHRDEAWNVSLGVAWHLGPPSIGRWSYYRPLFDVADNGSFMIHRR